MVREYGKLSYAPEKFTMNFWGNSSSGYWELFERKLPGNLIIAAYESPKTLEELSLEWVLEFLILKMKLQYWKRWDYL